MWRSINKDYILYLNTLGKFYPTNDSKQSNQLKTSSQADKHATLWFQPALKSKNDGSVNNLLFRGNPKILHL